MNMLDKLKGIMGAPTDEDEEYEDEKNSAVIMNKQTRRQTARERW